MNTAILKKVIDELSVPQPRLDYVRGMLETLYEIETPMVHSSAVGQGTVNHLAVGLNPTVPTSTDEGDMLNAMARAAMATMPPTELE